MLAVPELLVCRGSLLPLTQILSVVKWFSVLDVHWDHLTETFKKKKNTSICPSPPEIRIFLFWSGAGYPR